MKKNQKLSLFILVCFTLFTVLSAGCGNSQVSSVPSTGGQPKTGGILRYPLLDDPLSLDPANFNEELGINVGKEIYDGLVDLDLEKNEIVPAHAEKWDIKDNKVFTFYLRKGAKFHNGKEVTAEDFKYSFDRLLNPDTGSTVAWLLENVKGAQERMAGKTTDTEGIKVIDTYTLEITLASPSPSFLSWLAHPGTAVVDRETVEKAGKDFKSTGAKPEVVVGTGPFKLSLWKPKYAIKLVRNEEYYGRKAYLDAVEFKIVPDPTTMLNEFRAGNLDLIDIIPPGQARLVEKEFPDQVIKQTIWNVEFFGLNVGKSPFKDSPKLRQALNYAVDRDGIIRAVLEGNGVPAKGVLPPGMAEYNDNLKGYTYDPVKAAALLAEAGYPEGRGLPELEIAYNVHEKNQKLAEALQAQLKEIGVKTKLKGMPLPVYQREVGTGNLVMFKLAWSADSLDAGCILTPMFSSRAGNFFSYGNSEVDRLLVEAQSNPDTNERIKLYRQAEQIIVDETPAIWLFHPVNLYLKADNIQGVKTNAMDIIPLSDIWISG